jgi:2-polyprenyl-3-methyl-5-hydroxy-6-metoxy-1,4-benzoquinol methylase
MKCKTGAKALLARKILDVGCGAGSHSLYLQNRNLEVCSIDISPNAMKPARVEKILTFKIFLRWTLIILKINLTPFYYY